MRLEQGWRWIIRRFNMRRDGQSPRLLQLQAVRLELCRLCGNSQPGHEKSRCSNTTFCIRADADRLIVSRSYRGSFSCLSSASASFACGLEPKFRRCISSRRGQIPRGVVGQNSSHRFDAFGPMHARPAYRLSGLVSVDGSMEYRYLISRPELARDVELHLPFRRYIAGLLY